MRCMERPGVGLRGRAVSCLLATFYSCCLLAACRSCAFNGECYLYRLGGQQPTVKHQGPQTPWTSGFRDAAPPAGITAPPPAAPTPTGTPALVHAVLRHGGKAVGEAMRKPGLVQCGPRDCGPRAATCRQWCAHLGLLPLAALRGIPGRRRALRHRAQHQVERQGGRGRFVRQRCLGLRPGLLHPVPEQARLRGLGLVRQQPRLQVSPPQRPLRPCLQPSAGRLLRSMLPLPVGDRRACAACRSAAAACLCFPKSVSAARWSSLTPPPPPPLPPPLAAVAARFRASVICTGWAGRGPPWRSRAPSPPGPRAAGSEGPQRLGRRA